MFTDYNTLHATISDKIETTLITVSDSPKYRVPDEYCISMVEFINKLTDAFNDLNYFVAGRRFSVLERVAIKNSIAAIFTDFLTLLTFFSHSRAKEQFSKINVVTKNLMQMCEQGEIVEPKKKKVIRSLCNKLDRVLRCAREFVEMQQMLVANKSTTTV